MGKDKKEDKKKSKKGKQDGKGEPEPEPEPAGGHQPAPAGGPQAGTPQQAVAADARVPARAADSAAELRQAAQAGNTVRLLQLLEQQGGGGGGGGGGGDGGRAAAVGSAAGPAAGVAAGAAAVAPRAAAVDVNGVDRSGHTALACAASHGQLGAVKVLLAAGAELECRDGVLGFTPLLWAVSAGNLPVARALLARGASPAARASRHGNTPLHLACKAGDLEVATALFESGADLTALNYVGCTVRQAALAGSTDPPPAAASPNAVPAKQLPLSAAIAAAPATTELPAQQRLVAAIDRWLQQAPRADAARPELAGAELGGQRQRIRVLVSHRPDEAGAVTAALAAALAERG